MGLINFLHSWTGSELNCMRTWAMFQENTGVALSGRSQVKLRGSKAGFALSFFLVLFELDTQSETQEIWTSCKLRRKGRFLGAKLACRKCWADRAAWHPSLPCQSLWRESHLQRFPLTLQENFADLELARGAPPPSRVHKFRQRQIVRQSKPAKSCAVLLNWVKRRPD